MINNRDKKYIVIHDTDEYIFDDVILAIVKAKELTRGNDNHDTAIIISRIEWLDEPTEIIISSVRILEWVLGDLFRLSPLEL